MIYDHNNNSNTLSLSFSEQQSRLLFVYAVCDDIYVILYYYRNPCYLLTCLVNLFFFIICFVGMSSFIFIMFENKKNTFTLYTYYTLQTA